jgi:hypothetical protein
LKLPHGSLAVHRAFPKKQMDSKKMIKELEGVSKVKAAACPWLESLSAAY